MVPDIFQADLGGNDRHSLNQRRGSLGTPEPDRILDTTSPHQRNEPAPSVLGAAAMSSVGDVIAIVNLFERVILELRNYRDAPPHFQQLSVELDLLISTLRHASQLRPSNEDERKTLDKVGAIARACLIPLQDLVDKMRAKEGSLGHFRTMRSLANIGTRLHWSLISRKDIDGLRMTILSEMLAINMLLSTQQL